MLTLDKRPARMGSSINTRTEKHGDEDVPACDISLQGIMLEREELNALLGDQYAHDALYNHRSKGKADEPVFRKFKPLVFRDKFEEGGVTLYVGMGQTKIALTDVKLARVTLDPQVGGLTEMSVQVQCTPKTDTIGELLGYMNHDVEAEITFGRRAEKSKKQQDLPINTFGAGEGASTDDERPRRGRRSRGGDQPAAH